MGDFFTKNLWEEEVSTNRRNDVVEIVVLLISIRGEHIVVQC
jgi:hypothetical protein